MRLIDADKLKAHYAWWAQAGDADMKDALDMIIDLQPTVDPIKHGRWISINGWVECSVCHREPPNETNIESDYCPNCGADMREESDIDENWYSDEYRRIGEDERDEVE